MGVEVEVLVTVVVGSVDGILPCIRATNVGNDVWQVDLKLVAWDEWLLVTVSDCENELRSDHSNLRVACI